MMFESLRIQKPSVIEDKLLDGLEEFARMRVGAEGNDYAVESLSKSVNYLLDSYELSKEHRLWYENVYHNAVEVLSRGRLE